MKTRAVLRFSIAKSMLRESKATLAKKSKNKSMTKGFILPQTGVQYEATLWHIKHQILRECCSHETSWGFPYRKKLKIDKWEVKNEYKSTVDEHSIFK